MARRSHHAAQQQEVGYTPNRKMTATKSNYELAQEAKKRDPGNYQDGQKYRVWKYDGAAPQPVQVEMVFVAAKNWFYEEETDMACKVGGNSFIAAEPIDA